MTNQTLNDPDDEKEAKSISFWDPKGTLDALLRDVAHDMRKKKSELIYEIVAENIHEYADYSNLSETKRRWIRDKQRQIEEQYAKDLANSQQKRNTFLHYISSQIHKQITRGADKSDLKDWIREQKPLFENRDLLERYQHVLNEPGLYFSAYNWWIQDNKEGRATAFQNPELDREEGDKPYDRRDK